MKNPYLTLSGDELKTLLAMPENPNRHQVQAAFEAHIIKEGGFVPGKLSAFDAAIVTEALEASIESERLNAESGDHGTYDFEKQDHVIKSREALRVLFKFKKPKPQ